MKTRDEAKKWTDNDKKSFYLGHNAMQWGHYEYERIWGSESRSTLLSFSTEIQTKIKNGEPRSYSPAMNI